MNNLLAGLYEEYRILQNKIDKIADFGLKVRGWCITLQSALIIALVSGKLVVDSKLLVILLMFFIVLLFHFLEQEQIETRKILSQRARKVEYAIDRLVVERQESDRKKKAIDSDALRKLKGTPRTAIDLKNYGRNRTVNALKEIRNLKNWKIHIFFHFQYVMIIVFSLFLMFSYSDGNKDKMKNNASPSNTAQKAASNLPTKGR